ncbi:hypothetical protein CCYA_CCYA08G2327 [Cyanidiococcus yangmingshanensis]|nr:hypothetical protein CCYA_CCYA08G2327 [Cyanidiococcus yangmingshanensis]
MDAAGEPRRKHTGAWYNALGSFGSRHRRKAHPSTERTPGTRHENSLHRNRTGKARLSTFWRKARGTTGSSLLTGGESNGRDVYSETEVETTSGSEVEDAAEISNHGKVEAQRVLPRTCSGETTTTDIAGMLPGPLGGSSSRRRHSNEQLLGRNSRANHAESARTSASGTGLYRASADSVVHSEASLSQKLRSFSIRTVFTLVMLAIFFRVIYLGHQKVAVMVFVLQALIAREVLSIGYMQASKRRIPLFRTINAWFLLSATYFIYGKRTLSHFYDKDYAIMRRPPLIFLLMRHTFVSFWLFLIGFMIFVLSLRPGCYRHQLNQFARMLMLLLFAVVQANFIIFNIKEGLIWFVLPALMIIINDVMSYCVGFFFGRTRLTPLSPKKTWEGYIGGAIFTFIAGVILTRYLSRFEYMICPKPDFSDCDILRPDPPLHCTTPTTFLPRPYAVPLWAQRFLGRQVILMSPMLIHGVVLAAFASIVGPFGGFFASGVKRAFRVKDFADFIPGHGGVTDRMDCQLLMGAFTFVYRLNAVSISAPDVGNLLAYIADLSFQEQLELHRALSVMLERRGLISASSLGALIQNNSVGA